MQSLAPISGGWSQPPQSQGEHASSCPVSCRGSGGEGENTRITGCRLKESVQPCKKWVSGITFRTLLYISGFVLHIHESLIHN